MNSLFKSKFGIIKIVPDIIRTELMIVIIENGLFRHNGSIIAVITGKVNMDSTAIATEDSCIDLK